MHAVLFRIGDTSFGSHGVMLAVGISAAGFLLARELPRTSRSPELAWEFRVIAVLRRLRRRPARAGSRFALWLVRAGRPRTAMSSLPAEAPR